MRLAHMEVRFDEMHHFAAAAIVQQHLEPVARGDRLGGDRGQGGGELPTSVCFAHNSVLRSVGMAKFEYKYVLFSDLKREFQQARRKGEVAPKTPIERFIETRWNELGQQGWELVGVGTGQFSFLGTGGTIDAAYYFKRTL